MKIISRNPGAYTRVKAAPCSAGTFRPECPFSGIWRLTNTVGSDDGHRETRSIAPRGDPGAPAYRSKLNGGRAKLFRGHNSLTTRKPGPALLVLFVFTFLPKLTFNADSISRIGRLICGRPETRPVNVCCCTGVAGRANRAGVETNRGEGRRKITEKPYTHVEYKPTDGRTGGGVPSRAEKRSVSPGRHEPIVFRNIFDVFFTTANTATETPYAH